MRWGRRLCPCDIDKHIVINYNDRVKTKLNGMIWNEI